MTSVAAPQETAARGQAPRRPARPPRAKPGSVTRGRRGPIALLLAPFMILFVFAYALPLGYAVQESFFTQARSGLGLGGAERLFAGFDNYVAAIHNSSFTAGLGRVLLFGVVQVPVMLGAALGLALLFDAMKTRFAAVTRLIAFLPYAVPGVIAAMLWAFLYLGSTSPFAAMFGFFGLDVDFLGGDTVLWSMANIVTWTWTGYNMIIVYSSLQGIPTELYEAAAMDGASPWRIARSIKIPLVVPALTLTGVFSIIGTVQLYNEPMILRPFSAAIGSDYTPNMAVQNVAFDFNDYGLAAAMAVLLALGTFVLSFTFMRLTSRVGK